MIFRDLLGNILVNMGYVSEGQIEDALARQRREIDLRFLPERLRREQLISNDRKGADSQNAPLGDILQQMGLITEDQLTKALDIQKEPLTKVDNMEARKLAQIIELGSIVNSTLNISKVLKNVMQLANGVTDAVASTLMLLDRETGELVFSVPTGPKSDELVDIRIPPGKGIAGWVAENNKSLLIPDVSKDDRFFADIDEQVGFKTESILCVPLSAKGKMIGVLEAINKADGSRFNQEDELILGIFAAQAAMAIENARLYSEINLHLEELEKKQAILKDSEFRYRVVSELTTDFSFSFKKGPDGRFAGEWVTEAFNKIAGFTSERLETFQDWIEIFHPRDRDSVRAHFKKVRQGSSCSGEYRMAKADGEYIWLSVSCHPLFSDDRPEVERIIGTAREITDQVLAQEEKERLEHLLRQSQKMEALGTLTGGIAHDFNNILQTIGGSVQLLLKKDNRGDTDKYIHQIESATERAADLISRLLTFSRDMKPKLVTIDLNHELSQMIAILEQTIPRMILLKDDFSENLLPMKGDPNQLHQVVLNLASNAKDAMPEGGILTIKTENVISNQEVSDSSPDREGGNFVRLLVSDNGLGMEESLRQRMFEPFFTTKDVGKGTGLGLSTVYGIVKGHGGRISCNSEPGKGTSFIIDFPALNGIQEPPEEVSGRETEESLGGRMETILVVDDEPFVIDISKDILEQSGFRVLTASSGEEALQTYESSGEDIDMVLLDLSMPGMGGRKTLERLLELDPEAKIVISSGYTITDMENDLAGAGAAGYINKPYRLNDLLRKIREILEI